MLGIKCKCPAAHPKWTSKVVLKSCKDSSLKDFIKKPILPNFDNLATIFCPRLLLKSPEDFLRTHISSDPPDRFEVLKFWRKLLWPPPEIYESHYVLLFWYSSSKIQYIRPRYSYLLVEQWPLFCLCFFCICHKVLFIALF